MFTDGVGAQCNFSIQGKAREFLLESRGVVTGRYGLCGAIHAGHGAAEPRTERINTTWCNLRLEVDGRIKIENINCMADAGAVTFVAGSEIFGQRDFKAVN